MTALAPFDPTTMPLAGIRLVEASAGTGKTFSLAGLYLRLIVERGLEVPEILVMTFTRAATQELRERLRERLARAARIAAEPPHPARADAADALAERVIAAAAEERAAVAARLHEAAARIDQATITTIHGFAQKAAAEHAFESTLAFDRGEQIDDEAIHREAATDYWRGQVFGVDPRAAGAFLQRWPAPETMLAELRDILCKPHTRLLAPDPGALARARQEALAQWPRERERFVALLERARAEGALRAKTGLQKLLEADGAEAFAQAIDIGLAGTADGLPALPAIVAELGDDTGVGEHAKKAACQWFRPQDLSVIPVLARLQVEGQVAAAAAAVRAVRERAAALKRARRLYSFDDMIGALHAAVTDAQRGPGLAAALRRTWPFALVDEFQDTDPLQYAILRRIYAPAALDSDDSDDSDHGLILIGDPKQAIYGFRGGDVFAYLDATGDAEGRYGMDTNHRSVRPLLAGLDALFTKAGDAAFVLEGIAFRRVAAGRAEGDRRILFDGAPLEGLTAWPIPAAAGTTKITVKPALQAATVERVAALLDPDRAAWQRGVAAGQALAPHDIAVLVNNNEEAAEMQQALVAAGVPAVCIQQRSVFTTAAAVELLRLLRAAAAPLDRDRLRVALTTALFGYRFGDIAALEREEQRWTALTEQFQAAHLRWEASGVQAMLEPFLQAAAGRVAGLQDGERRMTDYLHLSERLQEAQHAVFGREGLVRWLAETIRVANDEGAGDDADRLRLENDNELVQVSTVHKAKGLQFPVVFLPYTPWLGTSGNPNKPPHAFHDAHNAAVIDLGSREAEQHRLQALREVRAEAVRSLYVALTRAEQACFFAWGAVNGAADSPLAWLLHREDGASVEDWLGQRKVPPWLDHDAVERRLRALAEASDGALRIEPPPAGGTVRPAARAGDGEPLGGAREDFPSPRPVWSVFSFSRLAGRMSSIAEAAGADDADPQAAALEPAAEPEVPVQPRGAAFGQAVHELLEALDFAAWPPPGAPLEPEQRQLIARALRRHGIATAHERGAEGPLERTAALIGQALHTALPAIGPLAAVAPDRRRAEIEFFLRLGGSGASAIMDTIAAAGYGAGVPAENELRGLMHGFIDLVVEAGGRYWVLDYKTNALGPMRADYGPAAMAEAVRVHRYDLQYLIYSVALHRYLRSRLTGYDPARHLGGVQYLFLRGMQPGDRQTGIHIDQPPAALLEHLDALFDGGGPA